MNAPEIKIRRAEHEDAQVFLDLVDALADYEKLSRPDAEARQRLVRDAFAQKPRFEVYLAQKCNDQNSSASSVVGYVVVLETYSTFLAQPTLFIEDIFIKPAERRHGFGRALFLHCIQLAKTRGCGRLEWIVLHWNEQALSFYHKLGAQRLSEWLPYRIQGKDFASILQSNPS